MLKIYLFISAWLISIPALAVWYETSGQAEIIGGDKKLARQMATQDAIKQALLFAGASVKSVQKMANGLLQEDHFEIRAGAEVQHLELISETYDEHIVTVSIRADIFAQEKLCNGSDYVKTIAGSWFPISDKHQAKVGELYDLGQATAEQLKLAFVDNAQHSTLNYLNPNQVGQAQIQSANHIVELAKHANSQFVLIGDIQQIGVQQSEQSSWKFWQTNPPIRHFSLQIKLFDGQTGNQVMQTQLETKAPWTFAQHQSINPQSTEFWRSVYGRQIQQNLQKLAQDIDEKVSCLPAYGRVLYVNDQQLQINIGAQQGVKKGDQLTLFQMNQYFESNGKPRYHYQLNPVKVTINQVFANTATASASKGELITNIQPNDFVARM